MVRTPDLTSERIFIVVLLPRDGAFVIITAHAQQCADKPPLSKILRTGLQT